MSDAHLELVPRGRVAIIRLNRPAAKNAMTPAMLDAVIAAVETCREQQQAIVIAGAGGVFSSGFDLRLIAADAAVMDQLLERLSRLVFALKHHERPVVVAAAGVAIAGACALIGGADLAVADEHAKLGYPVLRLGLSPAVSAPFLTRQVVSGAARRMMLDTTLISGREAHAIGLVAECVATPAEVEPRAITLAEELAAKPFGALAATRRWLAEIESAMITTREPLDALSSRALTISLQTGRSAESRDLVATAVRPAILHVKPPSNH